jgi:hypothetical protein
MALAKQGSKKGGVLMKYGKIMAIPEDGDLFLQAGNKFGYSASNLISPQCP